MTLEMPPFYAQPLSKNGLTIPISRYTSLKKRMGREPFIMIHSSTSSHLSGISIDNYRKYLDTAFYKALSTIIQHKGFVTNEHFSFFDDISLHDKEEFYLALLPKLDLTIEERILTEDIQFITQNKTTKGVLAIGGKLTIHFIEPVTDEIILTKDINLDDFHVHRAYLRQAPGDSAVVTRTIIGGEFIDTSEQALVEALNELYPRTVTKIFEIISTEELMREQARVTLLKERKKL